MNRTLTEKKGRQKEALLDLKKLYWRKGNFVFFLFFYIGSSLSGKAIFFKIF